MKYCLRLETIHPCHEIEISIQEFNDLKVARRILSNAFEIEQKYEIVIFNFLELEKELINVAITNSVRQPLNYSDFFETILILNIRLANLLTATKLYFDQTTSHLKNCEIEQSCFIDLFKGKCSAEYDCHFEYRFMDALRNHVQHHGMGIHDIKPGFRWTSHDDKGLMEYSLNIFARRSYLKENRKFKKSILDETSEDVNLVAAVRQYIESISTINEFVRELIIKNLTSARTTIELAHDRYSKIYTGSLITLSALEIKDSNIISSVPLLLDWDNVRIQLQNKNPKLDNLSKRYVINNVNN